MELMDVKMEKMFRKSKKELVDNASYYLHDITIDVFEAVFQLRSKRIKMVSRSENMIFSIITHTQIYIYIYIYIRP